MFTPDTPVDDLSVVYVEAASEHIDWGEVKWWDDEARAVVAERCDECGGICVMPYTGQNAHRAWLRYADEDEDEDDPGVPRDAYEIPFVVGMNVEPYLGFNYRVDELGDAVPYDLPSDSVEDLPEVAYGTPGRVDEIVDDVVYIVFEGIEPRIMLAGLDGDWGHVQIVEDEVYESLKLPENTDPKYCTNTLYNEGPMMNYRYPVELYRIGGEAAAARALMHLPVCLVEMGNDWYLALTGGGMDLSWELCEAYMRLGYLPPASLVNLPRYAGKELSPVNDWIIRGCIESCETLKGWQESRIETLQELRNEMPKPV